MSQLESVPELDARLKSVLSNADAAKKKLAEKHESGENAAKINEIYESTKKWDEVAQAVPALIDRLQALKHLHDNASQFSTTLTHIETVQSQVAEALTTQAATLKTVGGVSSRISLLSHNPACSLRARLPRTCRPSPRTSQPWSSA